MDFVGFPVKPPLTLRCDAITVLTFMVLRGEKSFALHFPLPKTGLSSVFVFLFLSSSQVSPFPNTVRGVLSIRVFLTQLALLQPTSILAGPQEVKVPPESVHLHAAAFD